MANIMKKAILLAMHMCFVLLVLQQTIDSIGVSAWTTDILPKLYIKYGMLSIKFPSFPILSLFQFIEINSSLFDLYICRSGEATDILWQSVRLFSNFGSR